MGEAQAIASHPTHARTHTHTRRRRLDQTLWNVVVVGEGEGRSVRDGRLKEGRRSTRCERPVGIPAYLRRSLFDAYIRRVCVTNGNLNLVIERTCLNLPFLNRIIKALHLFLTGSLRCPAGGVSTVTSEATHPTPFPCHIRTTGALGAKRPPNNTHIVSCLGLVQRQNRGQLYYSKGTGASSFWCHIHPPPFVLFGIPCICHGSASML